MKSLSPDLANDPVVKELLAEAAAKDRALRELRGRVAEHEQAYRQAQERINDYSRDWLYTTVCNFRTSVARFKRLKLKARAFARTLVTTFQLAIALLLAPLIPLARLIGIGRKKVVEREPSECRLRVGFNQPLPEPLVIGKGSSFTISGWAFHPDRCIERLELRLLTARPQPLPGAVVDNEAEKSPLADELPTNRGIEFTDRPVNVILRNIPDRRALTAHFPKQDRNGNSYWGGFYAEMTIPPITRAARGQLVVKAHLTDGSIESVSLGAVSMQPKLNMAPSLEELPKATGPLVAICMTTYNPPEKLFRRQIDSIRAQTHENWVCLIRDDGSDPNAIAAIHAAIAGDDRFYLYRNDKNLGFYRNFEAALCDVPPEADFVALSDQDDHWHADKLEALLAEFGPTTTLVYSDMTIASETGQIKASTYWTTRVSNHDNFINLLLANTVTGAASMFRRTLLDYLLPFPDKVGDAYHDHWLAVTAMALGKIGYIDRPLYDYVQHSHNVVGHVAPKPQRWVGAIYRALAFFWPKRIPRNVAAFFRHGYGYYTHDLLRIQHTIRNALLRCRAESTTEKIAQMEKVQNAPNSKKGLIWLSLRPFRPNAWKQTVGVEAHLVQAICWRMLNRFRAFAGPRITSRGGLRESLTKKLLPIPRSIDHIDTVHAIERITAPLSLSIHEDSPRRVNMIVSIIDFKYVFGGYITVFHLARCLAERGFNVRLIVVDQCDFRPVAFAENFRSYPGLEGFLDQIELVYAFDRETIVHVSPNDVFLPTSWWTAHIAHKATQTLGKNRFVYLVQEYEPGFYAYGALASFAAESYTFPHFALFSTELLREYFRLHGHGVFALPEGDQLSTSFQNTITAVGEVTPFELSRKKKKRLLFYCRPEAHALRNMFDIGIMALRRAVAEGAFAGWEFHGIGTLAMQGQIELGNGQSMSLLPRHNQESYRKILRNYDVGLSLMCSPHPSLVPLEMCSAGMLTVTNTYANKTAEKLLAISENFVPVEGTVDGVTQGLLAACKDSNHVQRRARGANVNWATQWNQSFHPALMDQLDQYLVAAMEDRDSTVAAVQAKAA